MRDARCVGHAGTVSDPTVERAEVVALVFNVSDIAVTLTDIEWLQFDCCSGLRATS
jgi:hypothetical protein